ncbi:hypothetical protein Taro_025463, partial [Colocasia esculenta]|nr:hypothetical protein [Colocasia esculenta]
MAVDSYYRLLVSRNMLVPGKVNLSTGDFRLSTGILYLSTDGGLKQSSREKLRVLVWWLLAVKIPSYDLYIWVSKHFMAVDSYCRLLVSRNMIVPEKVNLSIDDFRLSTGIMYLSTGLFSVPKRDRVARRVLIATSGDVAFRLPLFWLVVCMRAACRALDGRADVDRRIATGSRVVI